MVFMLNRIIMEDLATPTELFKAGSFWPIGHRPGSVRPHGFIVEDLVNPIYPTELSKTRHYRDSLPICGMMINSWQ
jgi:hypothetical protein